MVTTPALDEFVVRYPAFGEVPPGRVELSLQDAAESLNLSTLGSERVWKTAVMLKAAHLLASAGIGAGVESELIAKGLGGFSSISDGTVTASRSVSADSRSSDLETTRYGRALKHLLKHSGYRVLVANGEGLESPRGSPEHPVLRRV